MCQRSLRRTNAFAHRAQGAARQQVYQLLDPDLTDSIHKMDDQPTVCMSLHRMLEYIPRTVTIRYNGLLFFKHVTDVPSF